jgi:hypothetical protein
MSSIAPSLRRIPNDRGWARGYAAMSGIVDSEALMMFGLFGMSYAIPAAVLCCAQLLRRVTSLSGG